MAEPCPSCGSCGMPLVQDSDFSGGDRTHQLCAWCGDPQDRLKVTQEEVVAACARSFIEKQGLDQAAARTLAERYIAGLPVWKGGADVLGN